MAIAHAQVILVIVDIDESLIQWHRISPSLLQLRHHLETNRIYCITTTTTLQVYNVQQYQYQYKVRVLQTIRVIAWIAHAHVSPEKKLQFGSHKKARQL